MIIVVRISGQVKLSTAMQETLFRMRLRRKYTAVLMHATEENMRLLQKVRNFVAYGQIAKETLEKLIEKRGQVVGKKKLGADAIEIIEKKGLEEAGLKPFFRLHPPRGGVDTKLHFGTKKGVLGDNKESINKLVEKML